MTTYFGSTFSLAMLLDILRQQGQTDVRVTLLNVEQAQRVFNTGVENVLGHAITAGLAGTLLTGAPLPMNRVDVRLQPCDRVLVFQYAGPRLPEGATELPEGSAVEWLLVEVVSSAEQGA